MIFSIQIKNTYMIPRKLYLKYVKNLDIKEN